MALLMLAAGLLAGCQAAQTTEPIQPDATPETHAASNDTRVDTQGAVEVAVKPLNLGDPESNTLEFEVTLDTHSVDLSMNLAALASLQVDTGANVSPLSWSGGDGHHVQGLLIFPLKPANGDSLLKGAAVLRLILRDIDVPERVFEWDLPPLP